MEACEKGDIEMVKTLISLKSELDLMPPTSTKEAALHIAIRENHPEIVKLLLEAGADVDISYQFDGRAKWTPLHGAAIASNVEIIKLLLKYRSNMEARTQNGATPLILCARNYQVAASRALIKAGANVEAFDETGNTPAICAAGVGAIQIIQSLIDDGHCDLAATNHAGNTAFDEADRKDMWECAIYIWKRGGNSSNLKTTKGLGPVKWTRPRVIHDSITPRYGVSVASINSTIYAYGGVGIDEGTDPLPNPDHSLNGNTYSNQSTLYSMNIDDMQYTSLIPASAIKPPNTILMDRKRIGKEISVSPDGLTVTCIDPDMDDAAPSCCRADTPFEFHHGFAYFEITVLHPGTRGIIAFGLIDADYELDRLPGWNSDSVGYHSDDASIYRENGMGAQWGNRFGKDDIVGCGINFATHEVFFTLNGQFLGVCHRTVYGKMYFASVGWRNALASVRVNFGASPFQFDFLAPVLSWNRIKTFSARESNDSIHNIHGKLIKVSPNLMEYEIIQSSEDSNHLFERKTSQCRGLATDLHYPYSLASNSSEIYWFSSGPDQPVRVAVDLWPKLFRLSFENSDLTAGVVENLFPKPTNPVPSEYMDNFLESGRLLMTAFLKAKIVAVGEDICFIGAKSLGMLNTKTFAMETIEFIGSPPFGNKFSTVAIGKEIQTFGGWDSHHQRNDVCVLNTETGLWYYPHVIGISPRPRNQHSAIKVSIRNQEVQSSTRSNENEMDQDLQSLQKSKIAQSDTSTLVVTAFGWNGRNFIDDLELLSIQNRPVPDCLINTLSLSKLESSSYVTFEYKHSETSESTFISSPAIILASRASVLRTQISPEGHTLIPIDKVPYDAFLAFVTYLHDDIPEFNLHHQSVRPFVKLIEELAPEHSERILEALLLTRFNHRSRMGIDMKWALENPFHSDIQFVVEGKTILAHKCIMTSRSSYFKNLLTGGLSESKKGVIPLENVEYNSFIHIMHFIYTQDIDSETIANEILSVYILANMYSITKLKSRLETIISYNLSVENVCSILILATEQSSLSLAAECCKFIEAHSDRMEDSPDYLSNIDLIMSSFDAYRAL